MRQVGEKDEEEEARKGNFNCCETVHRAVRAPCESYGFESAKKYVIFNLDFVYLRKWLCSSQTCSYM